MQTGFREAPARPIARGMAGHQRAAFEHFVNFGRKVPARQDAEHRAIVAEEHRLLGSAQPRRGVGDGLEHGIEVRRRAADDRENCAGRRLLLQRLAEVARPGLHLVEQPRVLDGDHGLVGEGLHQFDVPRRKLADAVAPKDEQADALALPHQGNDEERLEAEFFLKGLRCHRAIVFEIADIGNFTRRQRPGSWQNWDHQPESAPAGRSLPALC